MQLAQVPARYAHLATEPWNVDFLSRPGYASWLDSALASQPLHSHERLADYVRARTTSTANGPSASRSSQASQTPSSSFPQPRTASPSHSTFAPPPDAQAPFASQRLHQARQPLAAMNGTNGVDFYDLIDQDQLDTDPSNSFATAFDHSFPSTSAAGTVNGGSPAYYSIPAASHGGASSSLAAYSHAAPYPSATAFTTDSPFHLPHDARSPYYGDSSASSVNPSFFSPPVASNAPHSSTLAIQSQLIQDERDRRNAAMAIPPTSFFNPADSTTNPSKQPSGAVPATTISPAMMTNPQFSTSTSSDPQPVASTSRSPSPSTSSSTIASVPASKKSSSTNGSSKPRTKSSSSSSTSGSTSHAWDLALPEIRSQLTKNRLTRAPASTAQRLLHLLSPFNHAAGPTSTLSHWSDGSDVPPDGRKEVLTEILKNGTEEFWKAWVSEGDRSKPSSSLASKDKDASQSAGVEVLTFWFEGASRGYEGKKDKDKMKEKEVDADERRRRQVEQMTLALVLQVFAKLPLEHRHLAKLAPVAKRVRKIAARGEEGAIKGAATRLYEVWKKIQDDYNASQAGVAGTAAAAKDKKLSSSSADKDKDGAKRKSATAEEAPSKKAKITTSSTTAKKPAAAAPPAPFVAFNPLKDAGLSFTKKKTEPAPSAMQKALSALGKRDGQSGPAKATGPAAVKGANAAGRGASPAAAVVAPVAAAARNEPKKKVKKSVRWRSEEELVAVRYFEKDSAEMEQAFVDGNDGEYNEYGEGMSLMQHFDEVDEMEEAIDWYDPISVEIPETEDFEAFRGTAVSLEAEVQKQREANAMAIDPSAEPPESPGEPPEPASTEPDPDPKMIQLAAELATDDQILREIDAAQASTVPLGGFAANDQIESLLGQLNASGLAASLQALQPPTAPVTPQPPVGGTPAQIDAATLEALRAYNPQQIEHIVATNPTFRGLSLESLGVAGGSAVQQPAATAYGAPAPAFGQPGSSYYNPTTYGPPSAASWQAPAAADAYNGYVPPAASGEAYPDRGVPNMAAPRPPHPHDLARLGKKHPYPCRHFAVGKCRYGEKCMFQH
ncbi:hypothetical protein JCM10212_003936 [Sporobolomyces blumeae]